MLRNPAYCGAYVVGRVRKGQFNSVFDEPTVIMNEVLTDENLLRCEAAYHASLAEQKKPRPNRIAEELRQKIKRAEEHLALAEDSADFTAISKRLRAWRKELSQILRRWIAADFQTPSVNPFRQSTSGIRLQTPEFRRIRLRIS